MSLPRVDRRATRPFEHAELNRRYASGFNDTWGSKESHRHRGRPPRVATQSPDLISQNPSDAPPPPSLRDPPPPAGGECFPPQRFEPPLLRQEGSQSD